MKIHPLWPAFCITLAPWAAAQQAQSTPPATPSTPTATFAPLSLNVRNAPGPSVSTAQAPTPAGQKGMIGIYLAQEAERSVVEGLVPGGPAEQAGMQAGDHITAIDGEPVGGWQELSERVGSHAPGEQLVVTVDRDGWSRQIEVTLAAAPEAPAEAVEVPGRVQRQPSAPDALFEKRAEPQTSELQVEAKPMRPLALRMRQSDEQGGSDAIRNRIVELRKTEQESSDAQAKSKQPVEQCCPKCGECCAQGAAKMLSLGNGGAWTVDVEGLEELPAIVEGEMGKLFVTDGTDFDAVVEGLPEKIQAYVHQLGKDGSGVRVLRVGKDGLVEIEADAQHGNGGAHEVRVLRDGQVQGLSGRGVIRVEGEDGGAPKVRVFSGTGSDGGHVQGHVVRSREAQGGDDAAEAHGQGQGARDDHGDLGQLRDELENLRAELRELRQALRRVQASGGGAR